MTPRAAAPLSDAEFQRAGVVLGARCGLRFHAGNRELLEHGLERAAAGLRATPGELIDRLERDASDALMQSTLREVTVGETYFFRHPEHFDFLRERVLPELLRERRDARVLRAWSAGCATGEETWSLAIALRSGAGPAWQVSVLGTDINKAALETARTGRYGRWSLRNPMPCLPGHVVQARDGGVEVAPAVRELVRFAYLNLHDAIFPSLLTGTQGLDLVFCRNVLLYFLPDAAAAALARLRDCLVEGGWLIVGALDVDLAPEGFDRVVHGGVTALRRAPRCRRSEPRPARPMPERAPANLNARTMNARTTKPKASNPETSNPKTTTANERPEIAIARQAADRGELEQAAVLARAAVERERTPNALFLLALILGECGRDADRVALLEETIERAPDYVLAHLNLGLGDRLVPPRDRARHLERVLALIARRRDEELLEGPDPLPVSWVRRMSEAALRKLT